MMNRLAVIVAFASGCSGAAAPSASGSRGVTVSSPPSPSVEAPKVPPADPSTGRLDLRDAIRIALERNPDLAALRPAEDVSRAALSVARTYPHNPAVGVDYR